MSQANITHLDTFISATFIDKLFTLQLYNVQTKIITVTSASRFRQSHPYERNLKEGTIKYNNN